MKKQIILAGIILIAAATSCRTNKVAQTPASAPTNEAALTQLSQETAQAFNTALNTVINPAIVDSIKADAKANPAPAESAALDPELQAIRAQMSPAERVFADKAIAALDAGTINTDMSKILAEISASSLPEQSKQAMTFFVTILQQAAAAFGPNN